MGHKCNGTAGEAAASLANTIAEQITWLEQASRGRCGQPGQYHNRANGLA